MPSNRFASGKTDFPRGGFPGIVERISGLIPRRGQTAFAAEIGMSPQQLNNILKGRKNPTLEMIVSIVCTYGANGHWLLTGHGEKYVLGRPC